MRTQVKACPGVVLEFSQLQAREQSSDGEMPPLNLKAIILNEPRCFRCEESDPLKGSLGKSVLRVQIWGEGWGGVGVAGEGLGKPSSRAAQEVGSGGGRAWDVGAPPRCRRRQLAWGWGVTANSPRRHRHPARRRGCSREVRGGFLLPDQRARGQRRAAPPFARPTLSALVAAGSPGRLAGTVGKRSPGTR